MPDDAFINDLLRRYEGDRDPLALSGVPASPPVSPELLAALHGPSDPIMQQARGMQAGMTRADPVELAMGLIGPRVRIPNPIKAYHGSPHDFDKFDMSKLLTGEGTNSVAPGLYFAEHEPVAMSYRDQLTHQPFRRFNSREEALAAAGPGGNAIEHSGGGWSAHDKTGDFIKEPAGKMYEVALHAKPEQFLDWDKPLKGQGPAGESAAQTYADLRRHEQRLMGGTTPRHMEHNIRAAQNGTGADLMMNATDLAMRENFTKRLNEAGIPGIRYLDQGSRAPKVLYAGQPEAPQGNLAARLAMERLKTYGTPEEAIKQLEWAGSGGRQEYKEAADLIRNGTIKQHHEGTSNYVVWSPDIIEILRKYGILGPAALGAMSAADERGSP